MLRLYDEQVSSFHRWLARELNIPLQQLALAMENVRVIMTTLNPTSLSKVLKTEGDTTLGDIIEADVPKAEDIVAVDEIKRKISEALTSLPKRWQGVLKMRYGVGGSKPLDYRAVGQRLKLSHERIRQIEELALAKIRKKHSELGALRNV